MKNLIYRKVEQSEIHKILELAKNILDFPLANEDKLQKNWSSIEAIGGFLDDDLMALLITDPYNLVRWTTGKKDGNSPAKSIERNYIKTAFLLEPIIDTGLIDCREEITVSLMNAYFNNMTFCDELVLYTTADAGRNKRRELLEKIGFQTDGKFPKKMVFRTTWKYFSEKKLTKILLDIKSFLTKMGLPYEDIDKNLIYTELLNVIIYILVDEYKDEHSIIKFFGYLAALPEINEEVVRYLLELNFHSTYCSLCVDSGCNVLVINSKLGPSINEVALELSLKSIAITIARYTEDIVSRFDGESLFNCILNVKPDFPDNYRYLLGGNEV